MEQMRSFIAIELPSQLKRALTGLEYQLKSDNQSYVKWVSPDSIHITLKFLGNIRVDLAAGITKAMSAAVQGIAPLHLKISGLGVFPNLNRVQVVWVGISGEVDKLNLLQKRLEASLTPLGFTPESRAFTPHLTLARLRDRASIAERQELGQRIANTRFEGVHDIAVAAISLMKSQLTREGPIYTRINLVKLKEG